MMIGINIEAGLCNRIFQLVFAYAFSKKYNVKFKFENWNRRSHHSPQIYPWLLERFMNNENYISDSVSYKYHVNEDYEFCTSFIDYYSNIKNLLNDNVLLQGFYQNEKYFKDYKQDILELLKEPDYITDIITKNYNLNYLNRAYFVHIRLGDYVGHPKHWIHLENYYLTVLEQIKKSDKDAIFIIFSNSIDYIDKIYPQLAIYLQSVSYIIIKDHDEVLNLYLMTRCKKGGISSNSTFGWWGGWLNQNPDKKLYFPSQWMSDKNYKCDIYPENSIIIPV